MKLKIGDKVKYIGKYSLLVNYNSVGIIVYKEDSFGYNVLFSNGNKWYCVEENLIKISLKNRQLLFSFME